MKKIIILELIAFGLLLLFSCNQPQQAKETVSETAAAPAPVAVVQSTSDTLKRVIKSEEEWREQLTADEYYILRKKGTERAFTGDLWDHKGKGTYVCAGCQLPLFSSDTKFKSGTGWPSYWKPFKENHIAELADNKFGWNRVEVLCARCDGHLGHVFEDGPKPTGLRYCINSASLDFVPEK